MKALKSTIVVMLLSLTMSMSGTAKAKENVAPVIWEFYNAAQDVYIYYNPASDELIKVWIVAEGPFAEYYYGYSVPEITYNSGNLSIYVDGLYVNGDYTLYGTYYKTP